MLKILGICGSPRKKSTYTALQAALQAAEAEGGIETELVELRGRKIANCVHCNKCLRDGSPRCTVYSDGMDELYDKIYNCDGIMLGSPVYEFGITPQLAAMFSRFRPTWLMLQDDQFYFARKVGAALSVGGTRNGGQEATINQMMGWLHTQGFTVCNAGGIAYSGAMLWNPGDGSTNMDDEYGMERARFLGRKLAYTTKMVAAGREKVHSEAAEFRE